MGTPLHDVPPVERTTVEVREVPIRRPSPSAPSGYRDAALSATRLVTHVVREGGSGASDALDTYGHPGIPVLPDPAPARDLSGVHHLRDGTAALVEWFDSRVGAETAGWMRGYARVTADLHRPPGQADGDVTARILVASPLYVEFAHDLP